MTAARRIGGRPALVPPGLWPIDATAAWSAGFVFLCILGWIASLIVMGDMDQGPGTSLHDFPTFLICWVIMLTAMMLPSEMLYLRAYSAFLENGSVASYGRFVSLACFVAGYGVAWVVYGALAYVLDAVVRASASDFVSWFRAGPLLVGSVLFLAGVYQVSPWKNACLIHCRSPLSYFARNWHPGRLGSLRMGLTHGLVCVGCCWALMAVMFAVGAMSLVWMAVLTLFMFAEKILPFGRYLTLPIAVFLWSLGIWIALAPDSAPLLKNPLLFSGICLAG